MNILRLGIGGRCALVMLALSTALAVGCSGTSPTDDDDEDGEGGTSSVGGTFGNGGTGSGQTSCLSLCQRLQMCPDAVPFECATGCQDSDSEAASLGCTTQYRNFLACWSASLNVCDVETVPCDAQEAAYTSCLDGSGATGGAGGTGGGGSGAGGSGNCVPGSRPANVGCSSLCARLDQCPSAAPDCLGSCATSLSDAAATGCSSVYQAFLDCANTCSDICALSVDDCPTQLTNYSTCLSAFCTANPSATPCL